VYAVYLIARFESSSLGTCDIADGRLLGATRLPWGSICTGRTGVLRNMSRRAAWQRHPSTSVSPLSDTACEVKMASVTTHIAG
jgi:hypothetical protein